MGRFRSLIPTLRFSQRTWSELNFFTANDILAEKKVPVFLSVATHCSFEAYLEEALHDRLVCGLRSKSSQKRLLSEADLTPARAVEIEQSMEAAHKNAQALKGPELPVRLLERLPQERGEVERRVRGQGGSLATVVVKGGIYRMSVASRKPPATSARKEDTLQRCVALLETQLTRAVPSGWKPRHPSRKTMMRLLDLSSWLPHLTSL